MKVPVDTFVSLAVAWLSSKVIPTAYDSPADRWLAVFALPVKVRETLPKILPAIPTDAEGVDVEAVGAQVAAAFSAVPELKLDFPPLVPGRKEGKVLTFSRADADDFLAFVRASATS